jgi:hypothetical protein
MTSKTLHQHGFGHVLALVLIIVVVVIGLAAYRVVSKKDGESNKQNNTATAPATTTPSWPMDKNITWQATGQGGWLTLPYDANVPACPNPLQLKLPTTDLQKATSILYPGQKRLGTFTGKGGNYKPHGGFRFDKATDNNISVVMPFDGYVMRGGQFLEGGEIQYDFDIVNPCGIMIRLGHLRELTPQFQAIADKFPPAIEDDSRTTKVEPMIPFRTGDKIATAVGFKTTHNVGFDYGVYDLRSDNEASKNAAYQAEHADTAELSSHALCWLDLLSAADERAVKALPAGDQAAGKTSDYCKH